MIAAFIIAGAVIATITALNPRVGSYCFWTLWMCYPTSLVHGVLPLNIRFDDLFLVYVTLCCVRIAPPDILTYRSVRLASLWFLSICLGNLMGLLTGPGYILVAVIQTVGKCSYVPMIAYVIAAVTRNERDARRQLAAILFATIGLCGLTTLQVYRPEMTSMWEIPTDEIGKRLVSETGGDDYADAIRRGGASVGVTMAAHIGALITVIGLRQALNNRGLFKRAGYLASAAAGLLTLAFSVSRGAAAGLSTAIIFSLAFFRHRVGTALLLAAGLFVVLATTDLGDRWLFRTKGVGLEDPFSESVDVRGAVWLQYLREFSPHYLLFGRGMTAEYVRHGTASAHSSYVGMFSTTGLFGAIVLAWVLVSAGRMGRRLLQNADDPHDAALGESLIMCILVLLIFGVSSEVFQGPQAVFYGVIALVDARLRAADARQLDWLPTEEPPPTQPALQALPAQ